MKMAQKKKVAGAKRKAISKQEISARLVDIGITQTSAIRSLEMEINRDVRIESKTVLTAACKAFAQQAHFHPLAEHQLIDEGKGFNS